MTKEAHMNAKRKAQVTRTWTRDYNDQQQQQKHSYRSLSIRQDWDKTKVGLMQDQHKTKTRLRQDQGNSKTR